MAGGKRTGTVEVLGPSDEAGVWNVALYYYHSDSGDPSNTVYTKVDASSAAEAEQKANELQDIALSGEDPGDFGDDGESDDPAYEGAGAGGGGKAPPGLPGGDPAYGASGGGTGGGSGGAGGGYLFTDSAPPGTGKPGDPAYPGQGQEGGSAKPGKPPGGDPH